MVEPELSRPVSIASLTERPVALTVEAGPAERTALAGRFGLLGLGALAARLDIRRDAGGVVVLHGVLEADVVQACVVTLEPVPAHVVDDFVLRFSADAPDLDDEEIDLTLADADIEPLEGEVLDVGEIVAQQLSLALDPYPRAPGAALPEPDAEGEGEDAASPFAALERLRRPH